MSKSLESPTGGERKQFNDVVDNVKDANSGLKDGGFTRFVHKFNHNDVMSSPTTSSGSYQTASAKNQNPEGDCRQD